MAFEKGNRPDSPMKRRGGRRRSESSYSSNQESKTYRFNAIRSGLIEYDQNRISVLEVLFFYCFSGWQTIEKGVIWG